MASTAFQLKEKVKELVENYESSTSQSSRTEKSNDELGGVGPSPPDTCASGSSAVFRSTFHTLQDSSHHCPFRGSVRHAIVVPHELILLRGSLLALIWGEVWSTRVKHFPEKLPPTGHFSFTFKDNMSFLWITTLFCGYSSILWIIFILR